MTLRIIPQTDLFVDISYTELYCIIKIIDNNKSNNNNNDDQILHRYFHFYEQGELKDLCSR